jgi:hypothetical protein
LTRIQRRIENVVCFCPREKVKRKKEKEKKKSCLAYISVRVINDLMLQR